MKGEKIWKEAVFEMNRHSTFRYTEAKSVEEIPGEEKRKREAGKRLNVTGTLHVGNNGKAISRSTMINSVDHLDLKFSFDFEGNTKSKKGFRDAKVLQQGITL